MARIETSDGVWIEYDLEGDSSKSALKFSNSLGTTRIMWDRQTKAFSSAFRILRYDTRGHGRSGAPEGPYTLERLGKDVVDLLDALDLGSVHFCGLSLGGMTGMWLGANAGDRVETLALCCTSAYLTPADLWNSRIRQVAEHGMASIADVVLSRWFTPSFLEKGFSDVDFVRDRLASTSPVGYAGCCAAIRDMDCRLGLAKIDKPCLVIAGTDDLAAPPEHGKLIAAGISGSEYQEIENAAHLANIEQEDAFNSHVLKFLMQKY